MSAHRYEYTATNGLAVRDVLDAAQELLEAHMKLLASGVGHVGRNLLKETPVRLALSLDLEEASEISVLNQAMRDDR